MSGEITRNELSLELNTEIDSIKSNAAAHNADYIRQPGYGVASGTNTKVITLNPAPTEYVEGMAISFKNTTANTGGTLINVNSLGAKEILKSNGSALASGNLKAGSIYTVRYNGTNFILQGEGGSGNAIASDLLSGKTASTDAGDIVGTIPSKGVATIIPTTSAQTIAAGQYLSGIQTIAGDANLIASNLKKDTKIFNVTGTLKPADQVNYTYSQMFLRATQAHNVDAAYGVIGYVPGISELCMFYINPSTKVVTYAKQNASGSQISTHNLYTIPSEYNVSGARVYVYSDCVVVKLTATIFKIAFNGTLLSQTDGQYRVYRMITTSTLYDILSQSGTGIEVYSPAGTRTLNIGVSTPLMDAQAVLLSDNLVLLTNTDETQTSNFQIFLIQLSPTASTMLNATYRISVLLSLLKLSAFRN